ncbi:MAG: M4 family metallopeptidase [Candidatus Kapaibacteriota bacterium]
MLYVFFVLYLSFVHADVFEQIQLLRGGAIKPEKMQIDFEKLKLLKNYLRPSETKVENLSFNPTAIKQMELKPQNLCENLYVLSEDFEVLFDPKLGIPKFVAPKKQSALVNSKYKNFALSNILFTFLRQNKEYFRLSEPEKFFQEVEVSKTRDLDLVIRYQQVYQRIPIWGKELIALYNSFGELINIVSNYLPYEKFDVPIEPKVDANFAINKSNADLVNKGVFYTDISAYKNLIQKEYPLAKLYIFKESLDENPRLVWVVELMPNIYEVYRYFVDAITGEILQSYRANPSDGIVTGTGKDLFNRNVSINVFQKGNRYYLVDATKQMFNNNLNNPDGVIALYTNNYQDLTRNSVPELVSSNNTYFDDAVAVTAHRFLGEIYDYYYNVHKRNSIDGNGKNIICIVHATENSQPMKNAFWNGEFMVFGDGGDIYYPFTRALDVIAHEFTHGVVQFTVDLEYKFQSGALNEAFADWGGAMLDREDWYIGEDLVYQQYFPRGTRNMQDPHNGASFGDPDWLPAHMSEYQNMPLERDNGGVHINVGIINKVTYLIGNSLGRDKLEKIYYRVLDKRYLTKQANFVDFRFACERSAKELFGDNSPELNAVVNAFNSVGIGSSGGSSPSPELPPIVGLNYILAVDQQYHNLYRVEEIIKTQNDIKQIGNFSLDVSSGSTYSVLSSNATAMCIDRSNMLRGLNLITGADTILIDLPIFRSIAIVEGRKPRLAFTTTEYLPQIYIYDVITDETKVIDLYQPSTSHTGYGTEPLFAVNLSWNPSGTLLIYDVINVRVNALGDTSYYAEINALEPESGVIYRLLPPLPEGFHVASPKFSQTNDNKIAFVVYNEAAGIGSIILGNIYDGRTSQIVSTYLTLDQPATPHFSPSDHAIVFQSLKPSTGQYIVYKQYLSSDKFSPLGQPELFLINAGIPQWIALGERSSVIEVTDNRDVFPNPFTNRLKINLENLNLQNIKEVKVFNFHSLQMSTVNWKQSEDIITIDFDGDSPNGFYIIEISDGIAKKHFKAIKLE